jgi:hypothetical protein
MDWNEGWNEGWNEDCDEDRDEDRDEIVSTAFMVVFSWSLRLLMATSCAARVPPRRGLQLGVSQCRAAARGLVGCAAR